MCGEGLISSASHSGEPQAQIPSADCGRGLVVGGDRLQGTPTAPRRSEKPGNLDRRHRPKVTREHVGFARPC